MGIDSSGHHELPSPGGPIGYQASAFVAPLILTLHSGGRTPENMCEIRADTGLRAVLRLAGMRSSALHKYPQLESALGFKRLGSSAESAAQRGFNASLFDLPFWRHSLNNYYTKNASS
jgi:hypothetical protein